LETDEEVYNFGNPLIIKCQEVLRVGDVITYFHEFWVNQRRVAKIQKIKPDGEFKLVLEYNDPLPTMHSNKRDKTTDRDGRTVDVIADNWRLLGDFQLIEAKWKTTTDGLPIDLIYSNKRHEDLPNVEAEEAIEVGLHSTHDEEKCSSSKEENNTTNERMYYEEASESINTQKMNYQEMMDQRLKQRSSIEKVALGGQKKQAQQVNKGRV